MPYCRNACATRAIGERVLVEQRAIGSRHRRLHEPVRLELGQPVVVETGGAPPAPTGSGSHRRTRPRTISPPSSASESATSSASVRPDSLRRSRPGRSRTVRATASVASALASGDSANPPSRSISSSRSLITFSGRKCSRCSRRIQAQALDVGRRRTCGIPTACARDRRDPGSRGTGSSRS